MKVTDKNVIRFQLQVLYQISVKSLEEKKERLMCSGAKVFGVPLEHTPRQYIPEFGLVPCFLVDACSFLLTRAGTVGLFRKPGSLPRIKNLRARLNLGEVCLPTSSPYDVSTLIKQFCRELPEPLFPSKIHAALLKAQALPSLQDKMAALQLLPCLLPAKNFSCLHYLFSFLRRVSQRCAENLMTSSNLATVFAPCLLPPPNKAEMSEVQLELRVLVLRTFIEHPHLFGMIPKAVKDSVEFVNNYYALKDTKNINGKRHSLKVMRAVKTPWVQAKTKVRPEDSEPSRNSANVAKLRRSLGLESFPNIQLFRICMPQTDQAAELEEFNPADIRLGAAQKLNLTNWRRRSSP